VNRRAPPLRRTIIDDPVGIPGMVTYASFFDPDGNRLQMTSAPPQG
jgi:predicted enzyme related to lactoylglutathione lyase